MRFSLIYTPQAISDFNNLKNDASQNKRYKAVRKALGLMEVDISHPGLKTHKYSSISGANGEEVFEAYAENNTPAAYRIFWHYGPGQGVITVIAITAHP